MVHLDSEGIAPEFYDEDGGHRRQGAATTQIREWWSPFKKAKEALAEKESRKSTIANRLEESIPFELKKCRVELGALRAGITAGDYTAADVASDITDLETQMSTLLSEKTDIAVEDTALKPEITKAKTERTKTEKEAATRRKNNTLEDWIE